MEEKRISATATRRISGMTRRTKRLTLTSMFVAIELMMWAIGMGQVPMGVLNMSFLTVPVAVGAILLGPAMGAVLGGTFGLTSLIDAITGKSVMTSTFFGQQPFLTVLLCVGTRVLMGLFTGWLFKVLRHGEKPAIWKYYVGAIAAPLSNTLFFMGYICLVFYQTEFVQNLVASKGAANPFMFVVLLVGVQGLIEAAVCCAIGGSVAKGVAHAVYKE